MTIDLLTNIPAVAYPEVHVFSSLSSSNLGSATAKVAGVFRAPKAGSIQKVAIRLTTVPGAGNTLRASLQTVNTTSVTPTGTLIATGAEGSFSPASGATGVYEVTLSTPYTVAKNEIFAVVVDVSTYVSTCVVGGHQQVGAFEHNTVPVRATASTGAYSSNTVVAPNYGIMIDGAWVYTTRNLPAVQIFGNNMTVANQLEAGTKFVAPWSGTISGYWWGYPSANALQVWTATLYDSSNIVLAQHVVNTGDLVESINSVTVGFHNFPSTATVVAGTTYRIALKVTAGAATIPSRGYDATSGYESALPGGTSCAKTQRTGAGAWTDTTNSRTFAGVLYSALTDGSTNNRKVKVGGTFVTA